MSKRKHITALPIKERSGYKPKPGKIPFVKKHHYFIVKNIVITGDAPKDFIRYYHYGRAGKANSAERPLYIAKLSNKHYSMESVTEYLLNRIGEVLGFKMAKSKLAYLGGQIRFLSEYFIEKPKEQLLDHGADLYAGYLNDRDFVEEIEKQRQSPDFFTVQFTHDTLKHFFKDDYVLLWLEFLKLAVLDAFIGNNDRHFYNWAIVRNIKNDEKPVFSPIYDTARGLFWNDSEKKIRDCYQNKNRLSSFIKNYSENSYPKIGWEGAGKINHFELLDKLKTIPYLISNDIIEHICKNETIEEVFSLIDTDFAELMSEERRGLIKLCLSYRHERIKKIFNFAI